MTAYISTQTGNWNDVDTWGGGGYPDTSADTVSIVVGHEVNYNVDGSAVQLGAVTVAGILSIDTSMSTYLRMNANFIIASGGEFLCGSSVSPLSDSYTFTYEFDNASSGEFGITDSGTMNVRLWGTIPSAWNGANEWWDTSNGAISATDTAVVTDNSTGWGVGDKLVIMSNTNNQSEVVTIDAISGTSITLDSGVTYGHSDGVIIFNIERNIIFKNTNNLYPGYITLDNSTSSIIELQAVLLDDMNGTSWSKTGLKIRSANVIINWFVANGCRHGLEMNSFAGTMTDCLYFNSLDKGTTGAYEYQATRCFWIETQDKGINDSAVSDNSWFTDCMFFMNGVAAYLQGYGVVFTDCYFDTYNSVTYANSQAANISRNGFIYFKNCNFTESRPINGANEYGNAHCIDYNRVSGANMYYTGSLWEPESTIVKTPGNTNCLRCRSSVDVTPTELVFDLPIDATGTATVTFYSKAGAVGHMGVRDARLFDEDDNEDSLTISNADTNWNLNTLTLSVVDGEVIKLAFELGDSNVNKYIYIDEITLSIA